MDTLHIILKLLDRNGITDQMFLSDMGFNRTLLSDWKSGKSKSYKKYLKEIAGYFNVSTDYLISGQEPLPKDLTPEQSEILQLWDKLDPLKQAEFKGEIKGYLKAIENKSKY